MWVGDLNDVVIKIKCSNHIYYCYYFKQVFVEVLDENDHTPLTSEPVYWVSVAENSPPRTAVARITALDGDLVGSGSSGSGKMIYHLKAGNPQSLFDIDPNTGTYSTKSFVSSLFHLIVGGINLR